MGKRPVFLWLGLFVGLAGLFLPMLVWADVTADREAQLNLQLRAVEADMANQQSLLKSKQKETASIQRDIDILTLKIKEAKLNIQSKQIEIAKLGGDIVQKQKTIVVLSDRLDTEKTSLSELLRQTRELDGNTFAETVLTSQTLSDLFVDSQRFNSVENSIEDTLNAVRGVQHNTETQKTALVDRRDAETNAKKAIEAEKANIEQLNNQKNVLLHASKAKENSYKVVIADEQKQKMAILNALYTLRGAKSITFGQALEDAKFVSAKTGVPADFLLAIITQESNLGQNIGTCNRPSDPPSKSYKVVMKPDRDCLPFEQICRSLGLDPAIQPVSCPMGGGYGGAMGPAQFIPSTWQGMKSAITAVTGNNPPNPWNPKDAFAASGLYLRDLGANGGTYTAERRAALKYYAGSNWASAKNAFYGDQVMALVAKYDKQINILQGS